MESVESSAESKESSVEASVEASVESRFSKGPPFCFQGIFSICSISIL